MANITKYLEKGLLGYSVNKSVAGFTAPTTTFAALFTQSPTVNYVKSTAEDGVEVSGGSYTRKQITWGDATASTDLTNSSSIKNSDPIAWSSITLSWGTVTTVGVFDNSGNLLWFGPLSTSVTLTTSDTFTIPANSLTLTLG